MINENAIRAYPFKMGSMGFLILAGYSKYIRVKMNLHECTIETLRNSVIT